MEYLYENAQLLEAKGYWKAMLPTKCHSRLQFHLSSFESWKKFYDLAIHTPNSNINLTTNVKLMESLPEPTMRMIRRNHLGEDGLLCFRVRLLLIDYLYNSQNSLGSNETLNTNNANAFLTQEV